MAVVSYEPTYAVSSDFLIGVADQVRRLTESTGKLTTDAMLTGLEEVKLQEKTVDPTDAVQEVVPDAGYFGLSKVTVRAAGGGGSVVVDSGRYVETPFGQEFFYELGGTETVYGVEHSTNHTQNVYTGTTGLLGVLEKLDELGAFVSVKTIASGTETIKDWHVSENCFLQCGVPNSGNSGNRWMDIKNGESVTIPVYLSTVSNNSQDWKIVQFDTGYYVYIYGNYASIYFFIGDTVDQWGNVKKGIATYVRGSSTKAIVGTDSIHSGETAQSLSFTSGVTYTKLSPVYSIEGYEKFKDVFFLSHAPNTQERSLEINGVYFYVDNWGKIAIRYNR